MPLLKPISGNKAESSVNLLDRGDTSIPWRSATAHPTHARHTTATGRRRAPRLRLLRAAVALGRGYFLLLQFRRAFLFPLRGARLRRLGLDLDT